MTNEKMTVHKALAELKTIDSRICSAINEASFVIANKHSNQKISGLSITEYKNQAEASFKKAQDLTARRNALKRAVVLSNARTEVTIAGVVYTVGEAIEMKNQGIAHWQRLLNKFSEDYRRAKLEADRNNGDRLEARADEHVKNMFDGKVDMKNLSEEALNARNQFIANQTYELIDPLKAKEKMEELDAKINAFMVEIDAALSVSNALTEIEISY